MRPVAVGGLAALVVAALLCTSSPLGASPHPHAPPGLPWPVIVRTRDARLAILPDGSVISAPAVLPYAMPKLPRGSYLVDRHRRTWVQVKDGRVVLRRGDQTIWRSTRSYHLASANGLWGLHVSRLGVAYEVHRNGTLWIAPNRGTERAVSTAEWPQMWTASGLITVRRMAGHRFAYLLRDANGRLVTILASHLTIRSLDNSVTLGNDLVFWNARGELVRTDGSLTRVLATARSLGFRQPPAVYARGGGLMELLSRSWHDVVLRADGSVFARAHATPNVAGFGEQTASADGTAVAYALTDETTGATSVYVLHAGDRNGTRVYHVSRGKGYPPTWHRHWLLFVDESGAVVAIDAEGSATVALTRVIRRLRHASGGGPRTPPHWSFAPGRRLRGR